MRAYLRNDNASKLLPPVTNRNVKRGILFQVLGAGTVWFGPDRAPLENTDSTGIPTAGNSMTSASGVMVIPQWDSEFWVRGSNVGVAVEINIFEVR